MSVKVDLYVAITLLIPEKIKNVFKKYLKRKV
jgi:hypothetical protein